MRFLLAVALLLVLLVSIQHATADPLINSTKQRIGNYDFEIATDPSQLVSGKAGKIMIRIASVNGDDLIDVPVVARLEKDGTEIWKKGPVIVPFGHYTFEHVFEKEGRYVLYADLNDYGYSGQTLTFTFFLDVAGPNDYLYMVLPAVGVAGLAAVILKKRMRIKQ
ncbi:MAG: hypothetical protein DA330_07155 [Nitrososphaera sp.]|nr:hypothetical protein [Nitrososphaera sp.]